MFSRRRFLHWAGSLSTLTILGPGRTRLVPLFGAGETAFRPELLPTQKEVWDQQVWMAALGPKYTGNKAHTTFVEFLATEMQKLGLDIARERYTLPRWDAKRWEVTVTPASRPPVKPEALSYFPYSGQTPAAGVTGELVYAGSAPNFRYDGLQGKVALVDFKTGVREWAREYKLWGVNPAGEKFPDAVNPARGGVNDLTKFRDAGAVAVIIGWADVSDANAKDQYTPFSRPPQGIPGLYIGEKPLAVLKSFIKDGQTSATVVLEADTFPNTPTDTIIATLPGTSADEIIIVNTHTDGPNATEENGALGLLALAKYFSKIPKSERRRTIVFPMTTGHFAGPWVPSMRGVMEKYPDMIKKAVAAVTVEHLGCLEWLDSAPAPNVVHQYRPTGKNEWSVAITPNRKMGEIMAEAVAGSRDRCGVVNPAAGGFLGEGAGLSRAGVPTIGYIPQPNYLLAGPANGCIEKLSPELLHSQIQTFAKVIHRIDGTSAAELKGI
jgi:hypothetical protein